MGEATQDPESEVPDTTPERPPTWGRSPLPGTWDLGQLWMGVTEAPAARAARTGLGETRNREPAPASGPTIDGTWSPGMGTGSTGRSPGGSPLGGEPPHRGQQAQQTSKTRSHPSPRRRAPCTGPAPETWRLGTWVYVCAREGGTEARGREAGTDSVGLLQGKRHIRPQDARQQVESGAQPGPQAGTSAPPRRPQTTSQARGHPGRKQEVAWRPGGSQWSIWVAQGLSRLVPFWLSPGGLVPTPGALQALARTN